MVFLNTNIGIWKRETGFHYDTLSLSFGLFVECSMFHIVVVFFHSFGPTLYWKYYIDFIVPGARVPSIMEISIDDPKIVRLYLYLMYM